MCEQIKFSRPLKKTILQYFGVQIMRGECLRSTHTCSRSRNSKSCQISRLCHRWPCRVTVLVRAGHGILFRLAVASILTSMGTLPVANVAECSMSHVPLHTQHHSAIELQQSPVVFVRRMLLRGGSQGVAPVEFHAAISEESNPASAKDVTAQYWKSITTGKKKQFASIAQVLTSLLLPATAAFAIATTANCSSS